MNYSPLYLRKRRKKLSQTSHGSSYLISVKLQPEYLRGNQDVRTLVTYSSCIHLLIVLHVSLDVSNVSLSEVQQSA